MVWHYFHLHKLRTRLIAHFAYNLSQSNICAILKDVATILGTPNNMILAGVYNIVV